jgi:hypothetical protein
MLCLTARHNNVLGTIVDYQVQLDWLCTTSHQDMMLHGIYLTSRLRLRSLSVAYDEKPA